MKSLFAALILLVAQSGLAAAPISSYSCVGQKLNIQGAKAGVGEMLIVVLDNGTVRVKDGDKQETTVLYLEGSDNSGGAKLYRTESTQAGRAVAIHNQNLNVKLGQQVYLYSLSLANNQVAAQYTLDCKVTGSSNF